MNKLKTEMLRQALGDKHPGVRRHAIRLCEGRFEQSADLAPLVLKLVDDPDPQVRMQVACTLGEWNDPRAGEALAQMMLANRDRFIVAAALTSVSKTNINSLVAHVFRQGGRDLPSDLTEELLGLVSALGDVKTMTALLQRVGTAENGHYLTWQYVALAGLLDTLEDRNSSLAKMADEEELLRPAVKQLSGLFQTARTAVKSGAAPQKEVLQALRILGREPNRAEQDAEVVAALLTPQTAEPVQAAAVDSLGRLKSAQVPELLLRGWKSFGPVLRAHILDTLLARDDWAAAILDALERKQLIALELDAARRQRLLQHKMESTRHRAAALLAGAIDADRQKVVQSHAPVLQMHGDPVRGTEVFRKTCASCHQLAGIGNVVGPDLASLGDKSPESLLIAILDPNRAVEARYVNYMAVTKSGLTLTGVLSSETGNSITLVGPDAKKQVILRSDLEDLISTNKSVMPEGLEKDLTRQNLADVIAFVRSGVPAFNRRIVEGNEPHVVQPSADGGLELSAKSCEIYGSNLTYEPQHGNLGFWRSEDDHAVWSIDIPRAGKYGVWLDWACDDRVAGNSYLARAALSELTGKVKGTGGWDNYHQEKIGEVALPAGRSQLVFRSSGRIRTFLIDLRSIKLVPVGR
jgi:putative heme-binding domain-containing protein